MAHHVDNEAREKVGQRRHIAIRPFDEVTGGVLTMELGVQPEDVQGKISSERVGGRHTQRLSRPDFGHRSRLKEECGAKKDRRDQQQLLLRPVRCSGIEKRTDDLRIQQAEPDSGSLEESQDQ